MFHLKAHRLTWKSVQTRKYYNPDVKHKSLSLLVQKHIRFTGHQNEGYNHIGLE